MEKILKILIVDDDEVDRMAIVRSLVKAGVKMEIAETDRGQEAISRLRQEPFDCIFLDYRLPDGNGLEVLQDLHLSGVNLPIIVLTGQGDEQIAVEIMKAGASDYLSKSRITPDSLAKTVYSAIRVHQAEQEAKLANQLLKESNELLRRNNKELEQQRQQIELQNLQLQEAYRLKSEFLATISHELRTPMNAIMGFAQLLLRQYPDPLTALQIDIVQRIFNNTQNLLSMINEVLDFSKIEAGQMAFSLTEFDISVLVQMTVEELRSLAHHKNLSLQTSIEVTEPILISDSNFLRRIVINLLSNAIKYTNNGEIIVKVWEISEDRVAIAVKDTGIGIPEEHLTTIFEAFRQVDQTLTRDRGGTGLGLAIVNSLLKSIRGTISVESKLGEGSIFTVELPRYLNPEEDTNDSHSSLVIRH